MEPGEIQERKCKKVNSRRIKKKFSKSYKILNNHVYF